VDEKGLVRQAKRGDDRAFEELITRNARYVFNLAIRVLRDPREAEDLTQEAFIRAWEALPNFQSKSCFRTWLYRIVTNLCFDRLPKLKKDLSALDIDETIDLPVDFIGPESNLLSRELESALHKAIEELPESYRLLITLRHMQELSYAEIAEVTMQPLGTVKTGIFRARQLLKQIIEQYENKK
jgi:RNA polymerase sigma-70 factor (ECF subfamily)